MAGNSKPARIPPQTTITAQTDRKDRRSKGSPISAGRLPRAPHQLRDAGSLRNDHGRSAKGTGPAASPKLISDRILFFAQRTSESDRHERNSSLSGRLELIDLNRQPVVDDGQAAQVSASISRQMPHAAIRQGDIEAGHVPDPPAVRSCAASSSSVMSRGSVQGDLQAVHLENQNRLRGAIGDLGDACSRRARLAADRVSCP